MTHFGKITPKQRTQSILETHLTRRKERNVLVMALQCLEVWIGEEKPAKETQCCRKKAWDDSTKKAGLRRANKLCLLLEIDRFRTGKRNMLRETGKLEVLGTNVKGFSQCES